MPTLREIIDDYLGVVKDSRQPNTHRTYRQALDQFVKYADDLSIDGYINFLRQTGKDLNPSSQALYRTAVYGLYLYAAVKDPTINLAALKQANKQYAKRHAQRLPFYDENAIQKVISYCETELSGSDNLMDLRDRAFVLTLADSGLRIAEACALRRGDVDWNQGRAIVIGKGDKQDIVHFSDRALTAIQQYLAARAKLDGASGKPLASLPLFARHDKGAGKKVKSVGVAGMWLAVKDRIVQAGVDREIVHPHSFRHRFITEVANETNDLRLTQELARHSDPKTTARYIHISKRANLEYDRIFNPKKKKP